MTILLLLAFGEGLKRQLSSNEKAMGENLAIHWPGETSKIWKGLPEGRPIQPRIDDIAALRQRLPELDDVWGEMTQRPDEHDLRPQDRQRPRHPGRAGSTATRASTTRVPAGAS